MLITYDQVPPETANLKTPFFIEFVCKCICIDTIDDRANNSGVISSNPVHERFQPT